MWAVAHGPPSARGRDHTESRTYDEPDAALAAN